MPHSLPALEYPPSALTRNSGSLQTSSSIPITTRPRTLHSWPGQETFDDVDVDDFEDDGTEDLPGLRTLH